MDSDVMNASPAQLAACQALVYSLLQRCEAVDSNDGLAVSLVSAHPGAGVSHIQRILQQMLNENEANCAIALDCEELGTSAVARRGDSKGDLDSRMLHERSGLSKRSGVARYRDRVGHLNALREVYRYVLLDCHSLKEKTDVLGLAPVVDGSIIVVECNRTTTSQVHELERSIERYGGAIIGSVLNKATTPVPRWVETMLEKAGI